MKSLVVTGLIVAFALAPVSAYAQRGHGGGGFGGGGGGFGGGHGGGGFHGGSMSHGAPARPAAGRPAGAPGHMAGGGPHFSNRPGYHGGWYHGDWGHWGGGPWGYRPWGWGWYGGWGPGFGWGLGYGLGMGVGVGIGLGSPWGWGYYSYYNPYWTAYPGGPAYINYSQPVVYQAPPQPPVQQYSASGYGQQPGGAPPQPTATQSEAVAIFDNARQLFLQGQYKPALTQTDRAIALVPNDSIMHEFRALCLFALRDYQQAAAAVYAVTSAGPGWDWTTVSNLYPNIDVYTTQLRALETYCETNPKAAAPRFLLAYHYLLASHNQEAAGLLAEVVRLEPGDQLSAQLLKGLTSPPGEKPAPMAPSGPVQPVDEQAIVGDWKASRPDGSKFELNLTPDKKFQWSFNQQDKQQRLSGTYTLANNYLILSASDQNALVGQVAMQPGGKLQFKLAGGNPADPGLTFTR